MTTITWNGTVSNDPTVAANWTPNVVPAAGTIALVATVTPGTANEPFGADTIFVPLFGPVFTNETVADQLVDLGGSMPAGGGPSPDINFDPFNDDQVSNIGAGFTIAEVGQQGEINFLSANPSPASFDFAGTMLSGTPGGTLTVNAQSYSFTIASVDLAGTVIAANGGTFDLSPDVPRIVAGDINGNSDTLAPDFVTNSGVIEAAPGGVVVIDTNDANFTNKGAIIAAGGTVLVDDGVSETGGLITSGGAGSLYVEGGVIDVATTSFVGEYVDFQEVPGTLVLGNVGGVQAFVEGLLNFGQGDTLVLPGAVLSKPSYSGDVLNFSRSIGGETYPDSETITTSVAKPNFIVTGGDAITLACFARGTRLLTGSGPVAVEALTLGMAVMTRSGSLRPIRWIGHRAVGCRGHTRPQDVWPVRILAGAFGRGVPAADLFLSPDHAVHAPADGGEGVLIPIRRLVNGCTILQVPVDHVEYWHVELDSHDVVLAEGLPAETYLETDNRGAFANGGAVVALHPDFAPGEAAPLMWEAAGCAPLRIDGAAVNRVIRRLRRRAARLGHTVAPTRPPRRAPAVPVADPAALLRPDWYRATYRDVAAADIDPVVHYARWGRSEGRLPCPEADLVRGLGMVDPAMLPFGLADLVAAGLDVASHYCEAGWRERRRINPYFDGDWYCARTEVPAEMNPLVHYLLIGERDGRRPGPHFDPAWYRARYALGAMRSPLAHYLAHCRTWRFSPNEDFDLVEHVRIHGHDMRPARDPYAHHLYGVIEVQGLCPPLVKNERGAGQRPAVPSTSRRAVQRRAR